jgi:acyl carrier protein
VIEPNEVETLIFDALRNLNEELSEDQRVEVSAETVLFGLNSGLDSLSLVSVVVDIESSLSNIGLNISLTDERAMSQDVLPFSTVTTLKEYILETGNES